MDVMEKKPNLLFIFGTRPECIKLSPLIQEAKKRGLDCRVCFTGQHMDMVLPILELFGVSPDYNFNIMKPNQNLNDISIAVMNGLKPVIEQKGISHIIVQGDTTSAAIAALMGFYHKIDVVHIEAGLRTNNIMSPWPEEFNRRLIGLTAKWHFTPTDQATHNLVKEAVSPDKIYMVGNTGIDALRIVSEKLIINQLNKVNKNKFTILVTLHRRESFGSEMIEVMSAIKEIVNQYDKVLIRWPLHRNPSVRQSFKDVFGEIDHPQIQKLEPMGYQEFISEMMLADLILTDSGGVQEEAPFLGKPVLICRQNTERPEAVECGSAILVGTSREKIFQQMQSLLGKPETYKNMTIRRTPFGDGHSSEKILDIICKPLLSRPSAK